MLVLISKRELMNHLLILLFVNNTKGEYGSPTLRMHGADEKRLALLHFKVFIHFSSHLRTNFRHFKPFGWFNPSILQVRVPLVGTEHQTADHERSYLASSLVSDLLQANGCVDKSSQATIAALVAWDFSLGMIFSCIITQKKDEDRNSMLQRMEPNLFLHLAGWEADPE